MDFNKEKKNKKKKKTYNYCVYICMSRVYARMHAFVRRTCLHHVFYFEISNFENGGTYRVYRHNSYTCIYVYTYVHICMVYEERRFSTCWSHPYIHNIHTHIYIIHVHGYKR